MQIGDGAFELSMALRSAAYVARTARARAITRGGFAHGFYVISAVAQVEYKCTDFYDPAGEVAIQWNDPELAIEWPLGPLELPILSPKDQAALPLRALTNRLPFFGEI